MIGPPQLLRKALTRIQRRYAVTSPDGGYLLASCHSGAASATTTAVYKRTMGTDNFVRVGFIPVEQATHLLWRSDTQCIKRNYYTGVLALYTLSESGPSSLVFSGAGAAVDFNAQYGTWSGSGKLKYFASTTQFVELDLAAATATLRTAPAGAATVLGSSALFSEDWTKSAAISWEASVPTLRTIWRDLPATFLLPASCFLLPASCFLRRSLVCQRAYLLT